MCSEAWRNSGNNCEWKDHRRSLYNRIFAFDEVFCRQSGRHLESDFRRNHFLLPYLLHEPTDASVFHRDVNEEHRNQIASCAFLLSSSHMMPNDRIPELAEDISDYLSFGRSLIVLSNSLFRLSAHEFLCDGCVFCCFSQASLCSSLGSHFKR